MNASDMRKMADDINSGKFSENDLTQAAKALRILAQLEDGFASYEVAMSQLPHLTQEHLLTHEIYLRLIETVRKGMDSAFFR